MWYKDGDLHREGGLPAIEWVSGDKYWYENGHIHREGGLPAIKCGEGNKWYERGVLHREGGLPAIEWGEGNKWWYVNGKLHREGGLPAVELSDGTKEWWIRGTRHTERRVKSVLKISVWYKRIKQRQFVLLVWRVMTPIYFHPNEIGGKKAIKALEEYDESIDHKSI